jgi:hypothetical protein
MDSSLTANLEAIGTSLTNGPPLELPVGINTYYENIVFSLNTTASVITIVLVLWTVLNVVFDTVVKDAEMKENVRYINTKLFGTSGLLNNLFGLWVVFLAAIYAVYGLMFLNSNVVAANIRVNQVSEKSILENLPIIGKLVGLINSAESS